jgi:hypothetical protein
MTEEGKEIAGGNTVSKPKSPQRTFVDVVRKGGKRRGYITVRKHDNGCLEVGYSLCELRDRFSGALGLGIALKRGARLKDRRAYVRNGGHLPIIFIGNGDNVMVALPPTILPRLLSDVERATAIFGEVRVPRWVMELRDSSILGLIHTKH